ncbi:unnamed protein product [Camellia sinensis]
MMLMECDLEHLDAAHFVLGAFAILEACTDVVVIHQHGASVHTLPLNLNVLNGSGKSQKSQAMITFVRDEWKSKIKGAGGCVHNKIKKDTHCFIVSGVLDNKQADMRKLTVSKDKKLPFDLYTIEAIGEESSMVTVKVKGPSAVLESSGLQNSGHILEDGKIIYNTTLNMSDLSTGVNSGNLNALDDYGAAMMEFEINMSAMPLEKLSKRSFQTGFDVHNKESLDEKYKKLHSDIAPLPHDSNDYRLIENYLQTTHALTHMDWALELEEVFLLDREGKFDKFYHLKILEARDLPTRFYHLKNARSHLTNFVGILSQGLRIAPPDAPATGYMGVYFADLVSKSTQYCFTDRNNPVGLMLLSEVALGEVYELKTATVIYGETSKRKALY